MLYPLSYKRELVRFAAFLGNFPSLGSYYRQSNGALLLAGLFVAETRGFEPPKGF